MLVASRLIIQPIKKFAAGGDKFFSFNLAFSPASIRVSGFAGIAVLVVNADAQGEEQRTNSRRDADHGNKNIVQTGAIEESV